MSYSRCDCTCFQSNSVILSQIQLSVVSYTNALMFKLKQSFFLNCFANSTSLGKEGEEEHSSQVFF